MNEDYKYRNQRAYVEHDRENHDAVTSDSKKMLQQRQMSTAADR